MSNQTSLKKQFTDQGAHIVAAFIILSVAFMAPGAITGFLAGLGIGVVREITEEGGKITFAKARHALSGWSRLDIAFWGVGGFLAGLLFG